MSTESDFNRRLVRTVAVVALAGVVLWVLYEARAALLVVYVSALLAMGFSPLVGLVERDGRPAPALRVPHLLAIFVVYLVLVGVLVGLALVAVPPIVTQGRALAADLPALFAGVQAFLRQHDLLAANVSLQEAVQSAGGNTVFTIATAASTLFHAIMTAATVLFLSFYLLVEGRALSLTFARLFPERDRAQVVAMANQVVSRVNGWLLAQLMLAALMGIATAVGLSLIGVRFSYVLALLAAGGEFIPMLGPFVAGACAVGIALMASIHQGLIVLAFFVALQQLESNVLVPLIMKNRVGLGAVTVIVALFVGYSLSGFIGAVLAVPTAAILSVVFDELIPERSHAARP
ncbi:MAG: AI-2E family transporter [Acidobacteriota bacterium]|nr:AI-2E family transporter [Acidobacteriota bacterium]